MGKQHTEGSSHARAGHQLWECHLKFELIHTATDRTAPASDRRVVQGVVERIGSEATLTGTVGRDVHQESATIADHAEASQQVLDWLASGGFLSADSLEAVGHRVVHGGDRFVAPTRLDDDVIAALDALRGLAPLHNEPALSAIRATRAVLGTSVPMVATFDTAFHHTMPAPAAQYAIPQDLARRYHIRRYGFHGIAHRYMSERYAALTSSPLSRLRLITLQLGSGCSAAAIAAGRSVDTSMGLTPLEGLMMGTRSGDMRELLAAGTQGDDQAARAIEMFCYRVRKCIGAYLAVLHGVDAVVFGGGIGENTPEVRQRICAGMDWCGLRLDAERNAATVGSEARISTTDANVQAYVIPVDEAVVIAQETVRCLSTA